MTRKNSGFTIIELLISMAILSLIAVAVSTIMTSTTRTYAEVNEEVTMQYQAQILNAQLSEYVIDCNGGIAWESENGVLYVVNLNPDGSKTAYAFAFDATEQTLLFGTESSPHDINIASLTATDFMSKSIIAFDAQATAEADGTIGDITLLFTLSDDNRQLDNQRDLTLRNQPFYAEDLNDLLDLLKPPEDE